MNASNLRPTIAVFREDGLAQRLKAVVSGLYLRDLLDTDLRLCWPASAYDETFHAIVPQGLFFNSEFNNAFGATDDEVRPYRRLINVSQLTPTAIGERNGEGSFEGVWCNGQLPPAMRPKSPDALARIYWNLPLAPDYKRVLDAARELDIGPDATGLHIRGGDILYGPYRFQDRFQSKVLPVSIARHVARDLKKRGVTPLVFAQDQEVIQRLRKDGYSLIVADVAKRYDFTPAQLALFEMSVLMRCKSVISGNSGFAEIAEFVSGAKLVNYTDMLSGVEVAEIIETDLAGSADAYNDLHKAFLWLIAALSRNPRKAAKGDPNPVLVATEAGAGMDPSNGIHPFLQAAQYLALGNGAKAEQLLSECLKVDVDADSAEALFRQVPILKTAMAVRPDQHPIMRKYFAAFIDAGNRGPFLNLFAGLFSKLEGNDDEAKSIAESLDFTELQWHPFSGHVAMCKAFMLGDQT